ncbi:MAG: oxidoreductase, partial [Marmoricola sp.]
MRAPLGILTLLTALLLTGTPPGVARPHHDPAWRPVDVGTTQQLRGLDAVDRKVAWVGGSAGGVWRTTDGGASWQDVSPPGADGLLFRDVEATDARHAQVLAIGEADASRIYRTTDGGASWQLTFVNDDPAAFYDCMAFWHGGRHGLAMSDPVNGKFRIIETRDAGASWHLVDPAGMPAAVDGEFGFAASGTCLVTAGGRDAWLGSGGTASRIFHSRDRGHTWTVTDSTIPAADAGGVFSMAFRNRRQGIAVGGDFTAPDNGTDMSAYTHDGRAWSNGGDLSGYRSGVSWVHGAPSTAVAVGPNGSDLTRNGGRTWARFSDTGFDAVQCTRDG